MSDPKIDALLDVIVDLKRDVESWRGEAEQLRRNTLSLVQQRDAARKEVEVLHKRLSEQRLCHLADYGALVKAPHHGGTP